MSLVAVFLPKIEVVDIHPRTNIPIQPHARGEVSENAPLCHDIADYLNHQQRPKTAADIATALRVSESTIKRHLSIMDDFCHIQRSKLVRGYCYSLTERGEKRYLKAQGEKS